MVVGRFLEQIFEVIMRRDHKRVRHFCVQRPGFSSLGDSQEMVICTGAKSSDDRQQ